MFSKSVSFGSKPAHTMAGVLILAFTVGAVAGCSCGKSEIPEPEMPRLLAYLPPLPEPLDPDENGFVVSFSNPVEMKEQHGYKRDQMLENMPVSMVDEFLQALAPARICANMGVYFETSHTQMDIGYDVMAVERCIEGGGVTYLEGDFDPRRVAESLAGLGYGVNEYDGTTIYLFNSVSYQGDAVGRELAASAGYIAALEKVVVMAATPERLQAALDVQKKQAENLSDVSQYVALAEALGPVVSAGLLPRGDQLAAVGYQEFTIKESEYSWNSQPQVPCVSPRGAERSGGYWTGTGDTRDVRYLVFAATYGTVGEAETEGERLVASLETHAHAGDWLWIGEPTVMHWEEGVVLIVAIELGDGAPGGVPEEVISVWLQVWGVD